VTADKDRGAPPEATGVARPTSFDIAYRAGVSQPTVSRALRGDPSVNEETRRRIVAVAQQLGYKVDKNASNLRRQHTSTLATLFFEDQTSDDSLINPFFLSMFGSITRACAQRGYDLLVSFQHLSNNWHTEYEDGRKADGIILLGYGDFLTYQTQLEKLVEQGTHFVRYGAVLKEHPGLSIGCDNHQGGLEATRHLIKLGRRRIVFLGHASSHYPEFFERYRGYADALAEAGLEASPVLHADAISTVQSGHDAANEIIGSGKPFDAVFAASDMIAIGALRALQDAGIAVPGQVSLVGFDDIPAANLVTPSLTTVMQDTRLAGEVLVDTLLKLVHGEEAAGRVLPTRLVVRHSCGADPVSL
jgi:DNA-binding LacI/PurR family transcriptional regulator